MTRFWLGALVLTFALLGPASADTFKLKPGREHKGQSVIQGKKLGKAGTKWIIKTDSGEVVTIEEADFAEIAADGGSDNRETSDDLGLPPLTFEPLLPDYVLQRAVEEAKTAPIACPDMIVLADGRRLVGTVTPTDTGASINVGGERNDFGADDFKEILPSPERAFQQHLLGAEGGSPQTWIDIAKWCLSEPLLAESRKKAVLCLQVAQSLDEENVEAREMLGYEEVGGLWLRGDDLAVAKGHKKVDGKWVPKEAAELDAVKQRLLSWGDIETITYRDAIRRVEDEVDACQIQVGKGDASFRPWLDECAVKMSSEERSWASAKRNARVSSMMAYARRYASADQLARRDARAQVMELERQDMTDIWNCGECGGSVNYNAQKPCPTCGGASSGGGGDYSDPSACSICQGSGRRKCNKCGGDGKTDCRQCANGVKNGGRCPHCDGGYGKCPKCQGTKTINCDHGASGSSGSGSRGPCSTCGGSGTVTEATKCRKCNGTGRAHQTPGFHK